MTNTEAVQSIYAAFLRGDVAAIQGMVSETVRWDNSMVASHECPWNADFSGRSRLPGFFKAVGDNVTFSMFEPQSYIASGNQVAALLHLESTVNKNGRRQANDVVHVWTFDDEGLVTSYRHYNDTAQELAAWRD